MKQVALPKSTSEPAPPSCPECGTIMGKKGKRWSGRHKSQLWQCSQCGRTRLLPINSNGHSSEALPPASIKPQPEVKPTFLPPTLRNKEYKVCDGLIPVFDLETGNVLDEMPKKPCQFFEDGHCGRLAYTRNCKYNEGQWKSLPKG